MPRGPRGGRAGGSTSSAIPPRFLLAACERPSYILSVTLNIRATQSNYRDETAEGASGNATHRPLVGQVVDELTSWNPREFIAAFQRWHQGEMSLTHLNVLTLLEAMGPQSMGHLAESLDVSEASMTGIIDRMEKRELVVRQRDGADRRVVLVVPAKGGAKVFADL